MNIDQNCKQLFFLSIIDTNQHLYEKTDYLFVDFIFQEYSYDDTYPVFDEMLNISSEKLSIRELLLLSDRKGKGLVKNIVVYF